MRNRAVIIFTKYPHKGKVKTRLAKGIGNELAAKFYKITAEYIFNEISKLLNSGISCYLYFDNESDEKSIRKWIKHDFIFLIQHDTDLGNRMINAFKEVFDRGHSEVIIIGTDVPDITSEFLLQGFDELKKNDLVICPAADGGYNFLGIKKTSPFLFRNIEWSSETVLQKTLIIAEKQKLKIKLLKELNDIDTQPELMEWLSNASIGNTTLKKKVKEIIFKEN
jgi:rSAM/selenodomain-associated transferase 1